MSQKFGMVVAPEGFDGAGKTTFVKYLMKKHPEYVYSREPGGSPVSEEIRKLLLSKEGKSIDPATRMHLFWASRAENIAKVIRPALEAGQIVITDRFDASTYAYQIGGDGYRELEPLFWQIREFHLRYLPIKYIFFNCPFAVAEARLKGRREQANHFDEQGPEYRAAVREHYLRFFQDDRVWYLRSEFNSDLPEPEMLAGAYEILQELVS
jgi:dTMP kinase